MNFRRSAILAGLASALTLPALAVAQSYEFTTCGGSGYQGPAQGDCDTAYTGTELDGDVTVADGIQSWTVPDTGTYRITATGAAGSSATSGDYQGGRGARVSGTFELTAGTVLQIVVGQEGTASEDGDFLAADGPAANNGNAAADGPAGGSGDQENGGGGGGSFVVDVSDSPMLIAGGGGGTRQYASQNGCDASISQYATISTGSNSSGDCDVKTDDLGLGGIALEYYDYGSAGAGFNGNGEADNIGQGGQSWANGMLGGHVDNNAIPGDGGFGGGGSGEGSNGGGGGGGYSGGDGGWVAGGGGSFNDGDNASAASGVGTGDGVVRISMRREATGSAEDTRTTFEVTKDFSDGNNPTEVDVTLSCNTGLILDQTKTIAEGDSVIFVVTDFADGALNCEITEEPLAGYTPTYQPDGPGIFDADGGCNFDEILADDEHTCNIVNDADPVEVTIEKVWVIDGTGGNGVDTRYELTLICDAHVVDGYECYYDGDSPLGSAPTHFCATIYSDDSDVFSVWVEPEYPSSTCRVEEYVYDDSVEIDNGCGNLVVSAGEGASCTITNSVFFEGIPTLSQYGMAVLALLMLGMGLVGFRRFS